MFTLDDLAGGKIPNEQDPQQKKQQASVSFTLNDLAMGKVPQEKAPAQAGAELPQTPQPVENPGFFSKVGSFFTDTVHNVEKIGADIGSRIADNVKEAKFMIDDNLKHSAGTAVGKQIVDDLNTYLDKSTALADKPWSEILKPGIDTSPDHINLAGRIAAAARKLAYEGLDKEMAPAPENLTPRQQIDYYTQAAEHIAAKRTAASYILGGTQSAVTSEIGFTGARAALTLLAGKEKADSVFKNFQNENDIPEGAQIAGQLTSLVFDSIAGAELLGPITSSVSNRIMNSPKIAGYLANPAVSPSVKALVTTWINNAPRGMAVFGSMNVLKELGDQVIDGNIDPSKVASKGLEGVAYGAAFPLGEGAAGAATSRYALHSPVVGKIVQRGAIVAGAVGVNTILSAIKALSNDGQIDKAENRDIWRSGVITGVLSILGSGATATEINNLRGNYTGLALDQWNMRTNPYGNTPVDKQKMQSVITDLSAKADAYSRDILHEAHPVRDFSRIEDDPNPYRVLLNKVSAYTYYQKDVDYIVKDNKIVLVDQNTGRPRPELTPSHGMNSALETKEGLYEGQNTTLPMSAVLSPEEKLMLQISNDTAAAPVASGKGPQPVVRNVAPRSIVTEFDRTLVQTKQVTPQAVEHFTLTGIEAGVNKIGASHAEANAAAQISQHTPEEVTALAQSRITDLTEKKNAGETLTKQEKAEATFLQKNIDQPEVLAKNYGMTIAPQETATVPLIKAETVNVSPTENSPAQVNLEAIQQGSDIAKEIKSMGTDGGVSSYLLDQIKKEDYTEVKVSIDELRKNDQDLEDYIKSGEIRDFEGDSFGMSPVVSSGGEVLDGYNRIAQAVKNGETEISILRGIGNVDGLYPEKTPGGIPIEYRRNGNALTPQEIADLKIPKKEKINVTGEQISYIDKAEKELRSIYSEKGEAANTALHAIVAEMKYAEAGKRVVIKSPSAQYDDEIFGVPSSFPEFISDELRRKNLFDKVYEGLQSVESIHIPGKGRSRQRQLYNELLNELDRNLGVNTLPIRETINEIYDKADKGTAGNIDISSHEGALAGRATEARKQEGPKEEVKKEIPAEVQDWAKNINPDAEPIQMFGMTGDQEWNIEAKNGEVFAFPDKPIEQKKEADRVTDSGGTYNAKKEVPFSESQQAISMKREMPIRSSSGEKVTLIAGEVFTPHIREDGKVVLQSADKKVLVNAATYAEVQKAANIAGQAKEFAPELKQTEETINKASIKDENTFGRKKASEYFDSGREIYGLHEDGSEALIESKDDLSNFDEFAFGEDFTQGDFEQTQYEKYQLPGGSNYQEILIKAPTIKIEAGPVKWNEDASGELIANIGDRQFGIVDEGLSAQVMQRPIYVYEKDGLLGRNVDTIEHAKELVDTTLKMSPTEQGFKSSHWSDRNVLAHLRLNERKYNGHKVIFMEELQSDWAREARANKDLLGNPLLKNWQEIAVKRALIEAVKSNVEYFAWANGKQQQERYNLSKEIDSIGWSNDVKEGNKTVEIQPKEGSDIQLIVNEAGIVTGSIGGKFEQFTGKNIGDVIGKGIAEKIMEKSGGLLSGNGLNIGGEWAINLYDKQVKNIVEFLTGTKVDIFDMQIGSENAQIWHNVSNGSWTDLVKESDLKIGKVISNAAGNDYVVTDIIGDGKFRAISKMSLAGYLNDNQTFAEYLDLGAFEKRLVEKNGEGQRAWIDEQVANRKAFIAKSGQEYDLGTKKSEGQQGIKLTDEVRAKIEGKATQIKSPVAWTPTMLDTSIIKDGSSNYYNTPEDQRTYADLVSSPLKVKYRRDGYVLFPNEKISSPADIAFAFQGLKNEAVEKFIVVGAKNGQIVSVETVSIGTIDASLVDPFESIDLLLKKKADSVYLVHNHPSGDVTPSYEDSLVTGRLKDAYAELNIAFKGHIIIDTTKYGLINEKLDQSQELQMTDVKNPVKATAYRKYVEWSKNKPSDFLMNNPGSIAQLVKGLNMDKEGSAAVVFVDTRYRVVSVQQMPQSRLTAINITKLAVGMRSKKIFIVNHGIEDFKLKQLSNSLNQNANIEIVDGITLHDSGALTSAQESGVIRDKGIDFYESDKPSEPLILKRRTTRQTIKQATETGIKYADKVEATRQAKVELENKLRNFKPEHRTLRTKAREFMFPLSVVDRETRSIYKQREKDLAIGKELANKAYNEFKVKPFIGEDNVENILLYESGEPVRDSYIVKEVQGVFDKLFKEANKRLNEYGREIEYRKNYLPQVYKEDRPTVQRALANYLLDKGVDPNVVSNYLNEIQEVPKDVVQALQLNPSFLHQRVFPDYKTAMHYGLNPRYTNIAQLIGYYRDQLEKTVANNKFIDALVEKGKITPLPLQGYEAINVPFSPKGFYANPEVANLLNSQFHDPNNAGLIPHTIAASAAVSRKMQEIALSAGVPKTSLNFFTFSQVIKEMTMGNIKSIPALLRSNSNAYSIQYFKDHANTIIRMSEEGLDLSGRVGNYQDLQGYANFIKFLKSEKVNKIVGMSWNKMFEEKTFQSFMPQLQIGVYESAYTKFLAAGYDPNEARKLAADVVRKSFGLIGDVGRSKFAQDTLSTGLFAPRFREGIINVLGNSFKSITTEWRNPAFYRNRRLVAGMIISYLIYDALNYELNKRHLIENPAGMEFELMIPTESGLNIRVPLMPSFLAVPRALGAGTIAMFKGDFQTAGQQYGSVLSMPIKLFTELITNRDFFGRAIYKNTDSGPEKMAKMAEYAGMQVNHPFIREAYKQMIPTSPVTGKPWNRPIYQSISEALELPTKYITDEQLTSREFYDAIDAHAQDRADKIKALKDKFDEILSKKESGDKEGADRLAKTLSKEEFDLYKSYKRSKASSELSKLQSSMFDIVERAHEMKVAGDIEGANALVRELTPEEYKAYKAAKGKVGYK